MSVPQRPLDLDMFLDIDERASGQYRPQSIDPGWDFRPSAFEDGRGALGHKLVRTV